MPPQTLAAVATLLSFTAHGSRVEFRLDHGSAELAWMSANSFHFRRTLNGPLPPATSAYGDVAVKVEDAPGRVTMRSDQIEVTLQKSGLLVRVRRLDGTPLAADLSEPRAVAGGVAWERQASAGVKFYGMGPRTDLTLDLRGKAVSSDVPFLFSTSGYGEWHKAAGTYRFDFTAPDRYRVEAPAVDYCFYDGATLKRVFEDRRDTANSAGPWNAAGDAPGTWAGLKNALLRLVHGAMSDMLAPTLALRPYAGTAPELVLRARQLGSLVEDVSPGPLGLSGFRKQLDSFYAAYAVEMRDRGLPLFHPLAYQFPEDPECALHADEFMLGDEMLVAPIYEPGGKRSLYLPQGVWTNLETNEVFPGRRTIAVATQELPVFGRNGTIIPLESPGGMGLHYFPRLPAEFFLLETESGEWTQVHAAPAGDIVRLQIESRKARDYQWVLHHMERPAQVGFEERKYRQAPSLAALANGTWFYDAAKKNLHIRAGVAAGEDCIINLEFP
jgi:hypothetical protein